MEAPVAVDADQHSITVAWKPVDGAVAYELQLVGSQAAAAPQEDVAQEGTAKAAQQQEWTSLSSTRESGSRHIPCPCRSIIQLMRMFAVGFRSRRRIHVEGLHWVPRLTESSCAPLLSSSEANGGEEEEPESGHHLQLPGSCQGQDRLAAILTTGAAAGEGSQEGWRGGGRRVEACGLRRMLLMFEAASTMSTPACSSDAGRGHEAGRGAEDDVTGGRLAGCGVGGGAGGGEVSELLLK